MNLLQREVIPGQTKSIVEYSSGSTVVSMSMVARVFHGIDDTRAYLSNKTAEQKLRLMQFFGLKLFVFAIFPQTKRRLTPPCRTLFGGPSQPEPVDPRGGIQSARALATDSHSIVNPNQYENDAVSLFIELVL